MLESPNFEQDHLSRTATDIFQKGHDSIRIRKRIRYYDRSHYENINYFDLVGSVLKCFSETSQR